MKSTTTDFIKGDFKIRFNDNTEIDVKHNSFSKVGVTPNFGIFKSHDDLLKSAPHHNGALNKNAAFTYNYAQIEYKFVQFNWTSAKGQNF